MHRRLIVRGGFTVVAAALAGTGCAAAERAATHGSAVHDSNRLVLDRSIGDVRLNMPRADAERRYGPPARKRVLLDYFPVGTRYEGKRLVRATYRIHGGALTLEYVDGKVKTISTTTPYYRTRGGIHAGARLPRTLCVRLDETGYVGPHGSKNTWRRFRFDGECLDAWLTSMRTKAMTLLYMHRSRRIQLVQVGDPDVILPCF
jgi:hypothetical protein